MLVLYDRYRPMLPAIIEYWSGGALYVIFWMFFLSIFSSLSAKHNSIFVTCATCLIEISQAWHPAWLNIIRSYKLGYAIFGKVFSLTDFPPYFLGGMLGYVMLASLRSRDKIDL